ncbi:MAG: OB-fold nucleic acid binding domain-containing protein, partial [Candidatus Limnocylindrales bacterium]
ATVSSAPFAAALEWRLVTVSGRVESVHRDGDSWRADLAVSGGSIPVMGLSRSSIPVEALVEGRNATVIGVVKRAYPTATDQRLALVPREPGDIKLGSAADATTGPDATDRSRPTPTTDARATRRPGDPTSTPTTPTASGNTAPGASARVTATTLPLSDLPASQGERVTVGGTVVAIDGFRLTVDDGSGTAVIRLVGDAASGAGTFGVGDLVNATGLVQRNAAGGIEIAVDDPAAISRRAQLSEAPTTTPRLPVTPDPEQAAATQLPPDDSPTNGALPVSILAIAFAVAAIVAALSVRPSARQRLSRALSATRAWLQTRLRVLRRG